jgi:hypothetical protein
MNLHKSAVAFSLSRTVYKNGIETVGRNLSRRKNRPKKRDQVYQKAEINIIWQKIKKPNITHGVEIYFLRISFDSAI